jgi:hypothetical protein
MLYEVLLPSSSARVPVPSGTAYVIDSPPQNGLCTRELADELGRVLETFAADAGFSRRNPVSLFFRPGIFGHHKVGRAADIYAVGGIGMDIWKERWDEATRGEPRAALENRERKRNLGWRLYKALQCYGRWAQPYGYPIQLFGPWTQSEGPWRFISDRLQHAHRDHIHVAK